MSKETDSSEARHGPSFAKRALLDSQAWPAFSAGSEQTLAEDIESFWLSGRGARLAPAKPAAASAVAAVAGAHRRSASDTLLPVPGSSDAALPPPPPQPGSARASFEGARAAEGAQFGVPAASGAGRARAPGTAVPLPSVQAGACTCCAQMSAHTMP